ncbi:MAG TPA: hypothetical protein VGF48_16515 [Thermoanaerobaculia bacterium]|jgi:hypothetical protein
MRYLLLLVGVLVLFAVLPAEAQCTVCLQKECQDDGPHRFCDVFNGGCVSSGICYGLTACGQHDLTPLVAKVRIVAPPMAPTVFELAWRQQIATPALAARAREWQRVARVDEREQ